MSVSPDGNFLAYVSLDLGKPAASFAVLRASDGGLVKVVEGAKLGADEIRWTPDGKALDYVTAEDGTADVWEQLVVGGKPQRITHFGSSGISSFHYSRDGMRLLVVRGPISADLVLLNGLR